MQSSDYNDFYHKVIQKCIDQVESDSQQGECIYKGDRCRKRIYKCYQTKRDAIKNKYMQKTSDAALDRHKVAACMIYAILKVQPIKVNRYIWGLSEEKLLANEYLAFYVALNIIAMYKKDELLEKSENRDIQYKIIVPKTYHEEDPKTKSESGDPKVDFVSNTCRALYYLRLRGIEKFDLFAYSTILFLLEKYTDTIKDIIQEPSESKLK